MPIPVSRFLNRNYLRVRGEYAGGLGIAGGIGELPPRARRIPEMNSPKNSLRGTTSACAENTDLLKTGSVDLGNYLRVRGEYLRANVIKQRGVELPPRARRIPAKTLRIRLSMVNYLRVRGEYSMYRSIAKPNWELPPRARRIPKTRGEQH